MRITRELLKQHDACTPGKEWFARYTGDTEHEQVVAALMANNRFGYAGWLVVELLTPQQRIDYAAHAAERVLPVFEAKYPNDDLPRKAIMAAKKYLADPSEENRSAAANAAFSAACAAANAAADAAYAANAAAYAANHARATAAAYAAAEAVYAAAEAVYAAYDADPGVKEAIIRYGLGLLRESEATECAGTEEHTITQGGAESGSGTVDGGNAGGD